mgnify:CR=1 FL=1
MNLQSHGPCTISIFRPFDQLQLLHRVRGEFREMPGMRLTLPPSRSWHFIGSVAGLATLIAGTTAFGQL